MRGDGLQIEGRLNSRHKSADDSRQPRRLSFADSDGQRRDEERDGRRERAQPACEERFMMEINLRIVDKFKFTLVASHRRQRRAFNYFSSD